MNYRPILDEHLKSLSRKHPKYSLAETVFLLARKAKGADFSKADLLEMTDLQLMNAIAPLERELEIEALIDKIELAENLYEDDSTPEDLKEKIYEDIETLEEQLEQLKNR